VTLDEASVVPEILPSVGVEVVVVEVDTVVLVVDATVVLVAVVIDAQSSEVSSMALHSGRRGRGFKAIRLVSRTSNIRSPA